MTGPGIRLTELEADALISAAAYYETDLDDRSDADDETSREARKERAALSRAVGKIVRADRGQG